ncbi:[protein-PII] uridylyltransferase family protein [Rhizorhabdus argentea]|uniref:[protein-PII] uridylyltransferase family protein n=1 Tax=Rhizorhabdus argentea TaxID=1387174 RepID=UPI0030EF7AB1
MRHDPRLQDAADGIVRAAEPQVPAALLLSELERRCVTLKVASGGERIDALFTRLDAFAALAADLTDCLSIPASLQPSMRRSFDAAYADLETAFGDAEAILAPLSDLLLSGNGFDGAVAAAAELLATLAPIHADAARLYDRLSRDIRALLYRDVRDATEVALIDAGFADPITAARRLREWQAGVPAALRSGSERRAFEAVLPMLVTELESFEDPDGALAALDEIVSRLPPDITLFAPLAARPSLMRSLLSLLGHAPALSRHLIAQPGLIGRLIDSSAYAPLPPAADLDAEFKLLISGGDRAAGQLRVAQAIGGYRFGLGLQLLEATADPLDLAIANCELAEAGLRAMADDVLARMKENHGEVPGAELVILALGRFGGRSLTSLSDLDLIYLFSGDARTHSNGRKPLDANEYFSRVAQQITTAMSTVTTLGPLYEIDTRLRPWGAKGLLACSIETFERYHGENAWTWEHMALTRARPVYGADAARKQVKLTVDQRLRCPRNRAALLLDAMKMRGDIARHKPPRGPFDVKLVPGGLVDLEFAVHVNQLDQHVGIHPRLRTALRSLVSAGLMETAVIPAHEVLSRMLIVLRLLSPHSQEPAPEQRGVIAQACGFESWDLLTAAYAEARETVQKVWCSAISQPAARAG